MRAILDLVLWVLGLFGIGKKDERDEERKAGEDLGRAKAEEANANKGLDEVSRAVRARDRDASDPDRVLDGRNPAARAYDPRPD